MSEQRPPPDPTKIYSRVLLMKKEVEKGTSRSVLEARFSDLKEDSPRIFEMVLENSPGYFEILSRMVNAANQVRNGEVSQEEMDKKVGLELAKEYVYPHIDMSKETGSS